MKGTTTKIAITTIIIRKGRDSIMKLLKVDLLMTVLIRKARIVMKVVTGIMKKKK